MIHSSNARRTRGRSRGLSLIEILVVLAIIGLIGSMVAFGVIPQMERARINTTMQSALTLRNIVINHRLLSTAGCPTIEELRAASAIDAASKTVDAWEEPFAIRCEDTGEIHVTSSGPDRKFGTDDDIHAPPVITTAQR